MRHMAMDNRHTLRQKLGLLRQSLRRPLKPLILTANGRSGTTWLMGLLARHPQISIYDHYPYERSQAAYFVQMYRVLTEAPVDGSEHREFRRNVAEHPDLLTRNPFTSSTNEAAIWYATRYPMGIASCVRRLCSDYYWQIARAGNKKRARLFAEYILPGMGLTGTFYELWPDTREIMLVRDMRDIFCSIRSFNAKRGYESFGREYYETDTQYIDTVLARAAEDMVDIHRSRGDGLLLVRYEDLVNATHSQLAQILQHLDLDASAAVVADMMQTDTISGEHMTSSDPARSIGKWRQEIEHDLLELCNERFRNYHDTFDYPAS